jgi:ATP-dependent Lon protease
MRDFRDAKAMAQTLRDALKAKSVFLTHSESLELIAKTFGLPDWNFLAARIQASQPALAPPAAGALSVPPSISAAVIVPILPIRDLVLFPQMATPIFVGREKTRLAVENAMAADGRVLVVTQRRAAEDNPALDSLYAVGVLASIINCATQVDGTLKLFVSGLERTAIVSPVEAEFLAAEVMRIDETRGHTTEALALSRAVLDAYQIYAKIDFTALQPQARTRLPNVGEASLLADSVAQLLSIGIEHRQRILETSDVTARLESILELMEAAQHAA